MTARVLGGPLALAAPVRAPVRRGDRLSLALMLAVAYCVAAAIHEVGWAGGTGFLIWDAWLAVALGYALAASPLPAYLAAPVGAVLGLEAVLLAVGNLWPPLAYVSRDVDAFGPWLERARWAQWQGLPAPFAETTGYVVRQANAVAGRLWVWFDRAAQGEPNADRQVWLLLVACGLLMLTVFAAWQLFRRWRPSLAMLPMGLALGVNSFLAGQRPMWVLLFLGLAITLMVRGQAKGLERRWQALGLDYSDELLTMATVVGLALAVAAMAVSPLVPALSSRATYDAFWRVLSGPWRAVEDTTGKLFGGLNSPTNRQPMLEGDAATPDLPSDHQVGAGQPLGSDIVMTVKIDDPAPEPWAGEMPRYEQDTVPQRHWRSATYDEYTGSGWENGAYAEATLDKGETLALPDADLEAREESVQEFSFRQRSGVLYAVGQPYAFDEPVTVYARDGGDVVSVHASTFVYEATSLVPRVTIAQLDEAGEDYPDWVSQRYLALPALPQRLKDLVVEVLAGADTPYRKARAVETYLRQFPYDLNVPQAPDGQDVVDYFVFDLQKGFCDYYATSMVVMLREAGVPARLATGYARGTYDRERSAWVVRQSDSHAWVEVYFPRYGWIEFEPTSGQSTYAFPPGGFSDSAADPLAVPDASDVGLRWPFTARQTTRGAAAALAGLGLLALLLRSIRRLRFGPERWAKEAYDRTAASAQWVGIAPGPNETVREYWQRLRQALAEETVFVSTPWGTEWVWQFDQVTQPLRYVLAAYEQSLFGRGHVNRTVARRAGEEGARVRRHFALLWLARRLGE